jgi:hydrogenase-4 transcriptional activator
VRELENVIERAMILDKNGPLKFDHLVPLSGGREPVVSPAKRTEPMKPDEAVSKHIAEALERAKGKIHGPGGAAELLGVNPNTLRARMN